MTKDEALKLALEALELAQDNLRDHGDNCFLHDEGEYNRCFCCKDSLSDFLQEQVESLSQAIEQAEKHQAAWDSATVVPVGDIRALKHRIHELEGELIGYKKIVADQDAMLERQTARIVELQEHIENFDGEDR